MRAVEDDNNDKNKFKDKDKFKDKFKDKDKDKSLRGQTTSSKEENSPVLMETSDHFVVLGLVSRGKCNVLQSRLAYFSNSQYLNNPKF